VKTRSSEYWSRPAAAVDAYKRKCLSKTALAYVKRAHRFPVNIRFDIVEVLLQHEKVATIRHLKNAFSLSAPYFYG
jgi:putative endonuclease